jgi:thiamine pyrophosphate-dependent acetolactate synthase large subunit-like protein
MTAVEALVKILKMEGFEHILGFPMNHLIDPAAKEGIRFIKARTERVAVNMTDGMARATGGNTLGITVFQHNQGIENAYAGIAQAWDDSTPLLVLPMAPPRRRVNMQPSFSAVKNLGGITKWVDSINHADQMPEAMRRAFTYLRSGRPGPVVLEIPLDVYGEEFDDALFEYKPIKRMRSSGDPADIKAVAKALIAAKNPIIRAGQGILLAGATDELVELAELLAVPVFTTLNGKSGFPENHPLSLGTGNRTRPKMVMHFLDKADLIFAIGSSCTIEAFTTPLPKGKPVIQSTIDERDLNKDYLLEEAIIGDAKLVLQQLIAEVKAQNGQKDGTAVKKELKTVKDEWLAEWMPKLTSNETPINPYRLIWDIAHTYDRTKTIMTHDAGNTRDQTTPFYETVAPYTYMGWGKSTTLGSSLGFAMGAKLARPEMTSVAICGDAGFGFVGMDFETAVREDIPIIMIIANNSRLGTYGKHNPIASERYDLNVMAGDYTKVAEGLGGYSEKVTQPDEIVPALKRAKESVDSGKAALLEFITAEEGQFST